MRGFRVGEVGLEVLRRWDIVCKCIPAVPMSEINQLLGAQPQSCHGGERRRRRCATRVIGISCTCLRALPSTFPHSTDQNQDSRPCICWSYLLPICLGCQKACSHP